MSDLIRKEDISEPKKRGPRAKYSTDEERMAARRATAQKANRAKTIVAIDKDIREELDALCDRLEDEFNFRPTMAQALRYMIKSMRTELEKQRARVLIGPGNGDPDE